MISWSSATLGNIADVAVGPAFRSAHFTDDPTDVRLLRGINIGIGEIKWGSAKYWPKESASEFDRFWLQRGCPQRLNSPPPATVEKSPA